METKTIAANVNIKSKIATRPELKTELIRKNIHFLIALTPTLASFNRTLTMALLGFGIAFYTMIELLRLNGKEVFFFSKVTALAARTRDKGRFVLGPVTLGFGALLALTFYPNPASAIAIYALAFGDGLASLVGKFFGVTKIPYTGGKSLEGSAACLTAVFVSAYLVSGGKLLPSILIAIVATVIEAMPLKDFDNVIIPASVGYMAFLLFS
jgi:dolichol kinase